MPPRPTGLGWIVAIGPVVLVPAKLAAAESRRLIPCWAVTTLTLAPWALRPSRQGRSNPTWRDLLVRCLDDRDRRSTPNSRSRRK